jgi:general secretion pathway protein B
MSSSKVIQISELKPGMMVLQITAQNGPVRIKKSGIIPSYDMVKGLTEMGVQELEIDLDNSLDLAGPEAFGASSKSAPKTQTQQLFMQDQQRDVESSMSEQFNRSLFLPSLQTLPSQWEIIGKQVGLFVLVIVFGGGLGFGAAKGLTQLNAATNVEVTTQSSLEIPPDKVISNESPDINNKANENDVLEVEEVEEVEDVASSDSTSSPTSEIEEGVVLNAREANNVTVSPEVAARLNKVLEDLGEPSLSDTNITTKSSNYSDTYAPNNYADNLDQTLSMRPEDGSSAENAPAQEPTVIVRDNVPRVDQLPASTLSRLPPMVFAAHMYSSNEADRWVRVNNRRLSEGDNIDSNVQIVTIEPQHVVLSFQGIKFRMNALSDW